MKLFACVYYPHVKNFLRYKYLVVAFLGLFKSRSIRCTSHSTSKVIFYTKNLTVWLSCLKSSTGSSFTTKWIAQSLGTYIRSFLSGFFLPVQAPLQPLTLYSSLLNTCSVAAFQSYPSQATPWSPVSLHLRGLCPMFRTPALGNLCLPAPSRASKFNSDAISFGKHTVSQGDF